MFKMPIQSNTASRKTPYTLFQNATKSKSCLISQNTQTYFS